MIFNYHRSSAMLIAVAAIVALSTACGSTTESKSTPSPSAQTSATAHTSDCVVHAPGPSSVDDVFAAQPNLAFAHICPAEVYPSLATASTTAQFLASTAGKVSEDGTPLLSVFAGELKAGSGDAFVQSFLNDLSSRAAPTKTLAAEPKTVGGYNVTYFNIPADATGYTFANGPTVVIAFAVAGGPKTAAAEDALAKILTNLH